MKNIVPYNKNNKPKENIIPYEKTVPYEENICSKMSYSDLWSFLEQAFFDKDDELDIGFYTSFLQNENAIKRRVKETKGTREFYILQYQLRKLYDY